MSSTSVHQYLTCFQISAPGSLPGSLPSTPPLRHVTRVKATATVKVEVHTPLPGKLKWAMTWQSQQNDCAPSEDSDQPGRPPSLIRVFDVRMKKAWVLSYPLSTQWRQDSDQTGRMPRLIWVFAGCTCQFVCLSWGGSNIQVTSVNCLQTLSKKQSNKLLYCLLHTLANDTYMWLCSGHSVIVVK